MLWADDLSGITERWPEIASCFQSPRRIPESSGESFGWRRHNRGQLAIAHRRNTRLVPMKIRPDVGAFFAAGLCIRGAVQDRRAGRGSGHGPCNRRGDRARPLRKSSNSRINKKPRPMEIKGRGSLVHCCTARGFCAVTRIVELGAASQDEDLDEDLGKRPGRGRGGSPRSERD